MVRENVFILEFPVAHMTLLTLLKLRSTIRSRTMKHCFPKVFESPVILIPICVQTFLFRIYSCNLFLPTTVMDEKHLRNINNFAKIDVGCDLHL